ncbi:MAG: quinone-dependent dihydroorotate dehydrogenase [Sediminibacterium sp.]|nr:quinone-dependent dihydroorotate dehydrogenase [Sediminibacterium sp.]
MYQLIRNLLFCFPPEEVHHFAMGCLKMGTRFSLTNTLIRNAFQFRSSQLEKELWGLRFPNPVGLGAGFDKNASYLNELEALGFGFVEIGTVTPRAQPGNDKPRLFRLPQDKALINRMGFNNDGVTAVKQRLINWNNTANSRMIIGGNIGKNKITPNEDAWKDYQICFNELHNEVDYFVVNVSSPNTPGLRELQEKEALRRIFGVLQNDNTGKSNPKPLLLKIAPDLTQEQLDDIISLSFEMKLSGLVATNTTVDRSMLSPAGIQKSKAIGIGGLSGKPVQQRSNEVLSYLSKNTNRQIPIIASGGIFTGEDAADKFSKGAELVQVWTGFVYEGPAIARKICTYLAR